MGLPVGAVLFDWRGTLVVTMSLSAWVERGLQRVGRDGSVEVIAGVEAALAGAVDHPAVQETWDRVDESASVHRETYGRLFQAAGLDDELADALYSVESDPAYNPFADDVAATLRTLKVAGVRVGIVSDIHFDLRPVKPDWRTWWIASYCRSSTAYRSQARESSGLRWTRLASSLRTR
jgi:phosphoglycolate phosphatase-like HAD superfamily hydrolase